MNYAIISRQFVKFRDGKSVFLVVIFADDENSLPSALPEWEAGSICLIGEGHQFKVLNSKGEWV